ncbi:hypothetical protein D3C86_2075200 [compost metagenome]
MDVSPQFMTNHPFLVLIMKMINQNKSMKTMKHLLQEIPFNRLLCDKQVPDFPGKNTHKLMITNQ